MRRGNERVYSRRADRYRAVATEVRGCPPAFVRARAGLRSAWFRCGRKPQLHGVGNEDCWFWQYDPAIERDRRLSAFDPGPIELVGCFDAGDGRASSTETSAASKSLSENIMRDCIVFAA